MVRTFCSAALVIALAGPAAAWTVEKDYGSWIQIRCGSGTLIGVKQKSNGKWADTAYLGQNFGSMQAAANAACSGRGG
ncbi:MAG: hypothetical protein QNJ44_05150 [Rhodobacter sp.]|nr:hypothetical protein [Rhodobacter sp.]